MNSTNPDPQRRALIVGAAASMTLPAWSSSPSAAPAYNRTLSGIANGEGLKARALGLVAAPKAQATRDQSKQFQTFLDVAREHPGTPLILDPGYYGIAQPVHFRGGAMLIGAGSDSTFIYALGPAFRMFTVDPSAHAGEIVGLQGLTLHGFLDRSGRLGDNLTQIGRSDTEGFARAVIDDVRVQECEGMGLVVFADEVQARRLRARRTLRDGLHFGFCDRATISDVEGEMCGDDVLAVHLKAFAPDRQSSVDRQLIIENVRFQKALGAKALGLRNGIIRNVSSRFASAYTVYVGFDAGFGEGASEYDCLIDGVTAWDTISGHYVGLGSLSAGVVLALQSETAGTRGAKPERTMHRVGPRAPAGPSEGITVANVKVRQTLADLRRFTDAGHGRLWSVSQGEVDPEINATISTLNPRNPVDAVSVTSGSIRACTFRDIQCFGGRTGILFGPSVIRIQDTQILGGVYERLSRAGVAIDPTGLTSAGNTNVSLTIRDGLYNLDPYLEAPGRQQDGSWSGGDASSAVGLFVPNVQGVAVDSITLKNARRLAHQASAYQAQVGGKELRFSASALDASNIMWEGDPSVPRGNGEVLNWARHRLRWVDSDPRSRSYGRYLGPDGEGVDILSSTEMPTRGHWAAGQFVSRQSPTMGEQDDQGKTLSGWRRLTTGSGHRPGADWMAVYDQACMSK